MAKEFKDGSESEFEVQAFLYSGLLLMGYRVRGEVKSTSVFKFEKRKNSRFDLVVFDNDWKPLEIIETKGPKYSIPFVVSKQYKRYAEFGIPVRFAKCTKTAFDLLDYYHRNKSAYEALYGLNPEHENASNLFSLLTT